MEAEIQRIIEGDEKKASEALEKFVQMVKNINNFLKRFSPFS